mmetsp:Transcript_33236/g.98793  ORF Transcript_33236/g.98793 Transcript_33236/m.98793 type:complete len:403 (-) Transcript_33236:1552-2760(-)|eukprot:CAMPEP_0113547994 /NCGR_PEP_ID=MMETSP0015_2-20120614/12655_1 /TAXON_ID=2838 /ORGANISM="Odontella" /LENGTH=402 /DNA_ID=CAMNT_0000448591 /DNA_START=342 /DNA_END=1550 /DNA_ORIENTATION=+ /assembly_acc=CAM_ASM_000160
MSSAVIVSFARTPVAKFRGSLASLTAPQLGSVAIKGALSRLGMANSAAPAVPVAEAYIGNVVSAGIGQAPCRQAVLGAGLPQSTICTTINKVCASGMKAVMLSAQAVAAGGLPDNMAMVAGGMESMTNIPHYLPAARGGTALGHVSCIDGVIHDGLWDVYNDQHMGLCAEKCSSDYGISREDQDAYCVESYRRAQEAIEAGWFKDEIEPVEIPQRRGEPLVVDIDEEPSAIKFERVPTLRPAFKRDGGTVTAANASSLNDGAAAMVIMSEEGARDAGLEPLARIRGYGDAARDPVDFTTAPSLAVPVALRKAGMGAEDVDYHEINEAFSVVALANMKLLNLDPAKVNVFGGAVALGHPIGMSGARIVGTLYSVLKHADASVGCASICNGGGGASAIIIERLK